MEITENSKTLKFDANGLIPAIVQDHYTKEVLTLAYMNAETLALTIAGARPSAKPLPHTQSTSLPAASSGSVSRCCAGMSASFIHLRRRLCTARPAGR